MELCTTMLVFYFLVTNQRNEREGIANFIGIQTKNQYCKLFARNKECLCIECNVIEKLHQTVVSALFNIFKFMQFLIKNFEPTKSKQIIFKYGLSISQINSLS